MSVCPFCDFDGQFKDYGAIRRVGARCPKCGSLERHRLMYLFIRDRIPEKATVLHFSPEGHLFDKLFDGEYHRVTLEGGMGTEKVDMTDIKYPDNYFDVVFSIDVMEHIPNDRLAMAETYRVLKNGGFTVHLAPMRDVEETYEDFSITEPMDRLRAFGQMDHVRIYGHDYGERLSSVGFHVERHDLPIDHETYNLVTEDNEVCHKWIYLATRI